MHNDAIPKEIDKPVELEKCIQSESKVKPTVYTAKSKKLIEWAIAIIVILIIGIIVLFCSHKKVTKTTVVSKTSLNEMQSAESELQANLAKLKNEETTLTQPTSKHSHQVYLSNTAKQEYLARQNAPTRMFVSTFSNSNTINSTGDQTSQAVFAGNSNYSNFGNQSLTVSTVQAMRMLHPDDTIASGEIIHAILETAVNSDLPGMVRAIVSVPVYGYRGENALVPAGSRLIGQYDSMTIQGNSRVFIMWDRLILPNGITIQINSPGTDSLGRAGMAADDINTHFFSRFGQATLLSVLGASTANVGVTPNDSANSAAMYRESIVQSFQQSAQQSLSDTNSVRPTLSIYQGASINVFVAHDLSFYRVLHSS